MISIILNTRSGTAADNAPEAALREFGERVPGTLIFKADQGTILTKLVDDALKVGSTTIVAAGGDGTVNAVASRLAGTDRVLGVLPLGTLNHFAKDAGIPLDLPAALDTLLTGRPVAVDVGKVNDQIFVNNSSLGLYPQIVLHREAQRRKGRHKWIAFAEAAAAVLKVHPFMTVRLSVKGRDMVRHTALVFVGNNEYNITGLAVGTRESLSDGRLCVYVTHHQSRVGLARLILKSLIGQLDYRTDLDTLSSIEITIDSRHRSLNVAIDGEVLRLNTPLHYQILPLALNVIVPCPGAQA